MHVAIVPGIKDGFRDDNFTPYDNENKRWRLKNILIPACLMLQSIKSVSVLSSREEAQAMQSSLAKHIFPKYYSVSFPKENYDLKHITNIDDLPSIQTTPFARNFIKEWLDNRTSCEKVITVTLRECNYEKERNSNCKEWGTFLESIDRSLYYPILIRDNDVADSDLPPELDGLQVFPEVVWNLELRAALYEISYLNMFVNGGLASFCRWNKNARSLTFKMITPSIEATTESFFKYHGLIPGTQLKQVSPMHRIIWEDDNYKVLIREFNNMCKIIESSINN